MMATTQTRAMINFVSLDDRPLLEHELEVAAEEVAAEEPWLVVAEDVVADVDSEVSF